MRTGVLILASLALLSFAMPSVAQAPEPVVIDGLSLPRANQVIAGDRLTRRARLH